MGVIKEVMKVVDWLCAEDEKEAMATSPGDSPKNVKTQKLLLSGDSIFLNLINCKIYELI